jgi:hypothetical protein
VKIEWSPAARATARRYMADQDGMRAIGSAIAQLAATRTRRKPSTAAITTGCASAHTESYT